MISRNQRRRRTPTKRQRASTEDRYCAFHQETEAYAKLQKDKEYQLMNKLFLSGTTNDKINSTVFFIDVEEG